MINNEDYQYDSCVSRGICSVNPRTSSLQEILILYLRLSSYYALKLYENGNKNRAVRGIILNTISVIISNPQFSETDFEALTAEFNKILPQIIKEYENFCQEKNIVPECLKSVLQFNKKADVIKSIQLGEKEFLKKVQNVPQEVRDLYKILFAIAKSLCTNVLDLETFGIDEEEGYLTILRLLSSLNTGEQKTDNLKQLLISASKIDNRLMKDIRNVQEKRYGEQRINAVSYSTVPGKAVLVVGSNIRELEDILEAVKDKDIDVYTHDEMMLAHSFPKFAEYKNLKGQYGQGIENCLLDFATFPGPIVLTRHSLYNVENLYRGLLFTTDFASSKGIIPVKNKDFSEVIKSAEDAKGFKTGRQCESVTVGYNYNNSENEIRKQISRRNFSRIFIIGLNGYTIEQQVYFDKLIKETPEDVFIVSLSYCLQKDNVICLNTCFDSFAIIDFAERMSEEYKLPITVFFPKCDRHTMSQMIYFSENDNISVFVGKCTPIILNPNLINTLSKVFGIKGLSSVKKDLEDITE